MCVCVYLRSKTKQTKRATKLEVENNENINNKYFSSVLSIKNKNMLVFSNSKLHKNHKGTKIKGSNYQNIICVCDTQSWI